MLDTMGSASRKNRSVTCLHPRDVIDDTGYLGGRIGEGGRDLTTSSDDDLRLTLIKVSVFYQHLFQSPGLY